MMKRPFLLLPLASSAFFFADLRDAAAQRTPSQVTRDPAAPGVAAPPAAAPAAPASPNAGGSAGGTVPGAGAAPGVGSVPVPGAAGAGKPALTPGGKSTADTAGLPQFEQTMEFEPRSPNFKVGFSLEDADLPELVKVIGQLTGKRFIFGGKVRSIKASIYSPQKVTVAEAYQAFLSILETNGLTVVPHGRFLKIVETAGVASQSTPMYTAAQGAPSEDRYVTRIHRLGHVSADEVANILGKFKTKEGDITVYAPGNLLIMTDTGTNIRRMMQLVEEIDVGEAGDQIWIEPVHYAAASDVEKRINELFDVKSGAAASGGSPAPAGGKPNPPHITVGGGDLHISKIVADDRSNSLVIVATERAYLRILEFIRRIDIPQTGEGEIHVFPLQHADAIELTKTLTEIITGAGGAAPPGGGARPATGAAGAPQGIFEGGVKVSADKATNSIVVTSSQRDYAALRIVVDRLDQARKQVFIEAVIMDLQLKRRDVFGMSFHAGDTFSTSQGDGLIYGGNKPLNTISLLPTDPDALQGFALGVRGPGLSGSQNFLGTGVTIPAFGTFIQALAQTGDTDLLSTPHILATDNIKAEISVGDNVPLQQNVGGGLGALAGAAGGAAGGAGALGGLGALGLGGLGFSAPRQDVGTKISIIPHLNESNEVRLELTEEISEQGAPTGALGVIPISKRTANTTLVVRDQQTVVIGGLIRNVSRRQEDKVPVLGDIPVLGALFRRTENGFEKRNLVLILTPYIIREQSDLRTVFERKMQERQEYLDRYFVFSDSNQYEPPKDYTRTNGLVEDIRQGFLNVEERRRLEELTRPKELKRHEPGQPLEMPAPTSTRSPTAGGGPAAPVPNPNSAAVPAPPPPSLNISPSPRSVDRIEK
jgi:general secretion pathway protein D